MLPYSEMMKAIRIIRWIGRITSVLFAIILVCVGVILFRGSFTKGFKTNDLFSMIFFIVLIAGLIIQWPKELAGIIIASIGMTGLLLMILSYSGKDPFLILVLYIPTAILMICRRIETKQTVPEN
jgi:hypothetical protein